MGWPASFSGSSWHCANSTLIFLVQSSVSQLLVALANQLSLNQAVGLTHHHGLPVGLGPEVRWSLGLVEGAAMEVPEDGPHSPVAVHEGVDLLKLHIPLVG